MYTQSQIDRELGIPHNWQEHEPEIFIYKDDANAVEKIRVPGSIVEISEKKQVAKVHAQKSEEIFETVSLRAAEIGMRVNEKKTQLLCVSASTYTEVNSYIRYNGSRIMSTDSLKILGFVFGSRPTVRPHVDNLIKKLKRNCGLCGMPKEQALARMTYLGRSTFLSGQPLNTQCQPIIQCLIPV